MITILIENYDPYKNEKYYFGKEVRISSWQYQAKNTILKSLQMPYKNAKIIINKKEKKTVYNFNNDELIIEIQKINEELLAIKQISIFGIIEDEISKYINKVELNRWFDPFESFYSLELKN